MTCTSAVHAEFGLNTVTAPVPASEGDLVGTSEAIGVGCAEGCAVGFSSEHCAPSYSESHTHSASTHSACVQDDASHAPWPLQCIPIVESADAGVLHAHKPQKPSQPFQLM